jgi:hypothetical protein
MTRTDTERWVWYREGEPTLREWGWLIPASVLNEQGKVELMHSDLSEAEIREACARMVASWKEEGIVGEELLDSVDRLEADLRRWPG